jgi:hypothetical protein
VQAKHKVLVEENTAMVSCKIIILVNLKNGVIVPKSGLNKSLSLLKLAINSKKPDSLLKIFM